MEKQRRLSMNSATILVDDILYFAINNGNGLFSYNLSSEALMFLGYFPGESKEQSDLYYTAARYYNYLLFPPYHAEKFAVYDIEKHKFTEWDFLQQMKKKEVGRAILYNDKMYLFGTWVDPYLLKVDLLKKSVEFDQTWMNEIHPEKRAEKYCRIETKDINRNGRNLFITVTTDKGAEVLCFDMEKEVIDKIGLPFVASEFWWVYYSTAYGNENKIWAVRHTNGQIIELDRKTGSYVLYDTPIGKGVKENSYKRIFQGDNCLLLIPYTANHIIKLDVNTRSLDILYCDTEDEINEYKDSWEKYSWSEYKDGVLYVFRTYTCLLKIFDTISSRMKEIVFPDNNNAISMYILYEKCVYEGLTVNNNLEVYLDVISKYSNNSITRGKNCGMRIYDQITGGNKNF